MDPHSPQIMYEASQIYVREEAEAWNLRPNQPYRSPRLNRELTIAAPVNAELSLQAKALQQTNELVLRLGRELIKAREEMIVALKEIQSLVTSTKGDSSKSRAALDKITADLERLKRTMADLEVPFL